MEDQQKPLQYTMMMQIDFHRRRRRFLGIRAAEREELLKGKRFEEVFVLEVGISGCVSRLSSRGETQMLAWVGQGGRRGLSRGAVENEAFAVLIRAGAGEVVLLVGFYVSIKISRPGAYRIETHHSALKELIGII